MVLSLELSLELTLGLFVGLGSTNKNEVLAIWLLGMELMSGVANEVLNRLISFI